MKLPKNGIKLRKSFFVPNWIIRDFAEEISDFLGAMDDCWLEALVSLVLLMALVLLKMLVSLTSSL